MFPFEKHFEFRKGAKTLRLLLFVSLQLFVLLQANQVEAKTYVFNSKILSSTFPFNICPMGTDTIVIRDTFEINTNYEPILFGLPFDGTLLVDGGVLYWSSNVFLKLGTNARIVLHHGGRIYPGNVSDVLATA